MHCIQNLPDDYREVKVYNLQKDKKTAFIINALAVIIMIVMIFIRPFSFYRERLGSILKLVIMLIGMFIYVVLHEFTHGFAMKHYGGKEVKYGFTGLYAFAGSTADFFDKYAYIRIALAPITIWGIIFLVLEILLPAGWKPIVYFLQIANFSGAAGDLFISYQVSRMKNTLYVKDTGVDMTVYDK